MNIQTTISEQIKKILSDSGSIMEISCSPGAHILLRNYFREATGKNSVSKVVSFSGYAVKVVSALSGNVVVIHYNLKDGVLPRSVMVNLS